MITTETKKVEEKIMRNFEKATSESNTLGIQIGNSSTKLIGMDACDPDGLSAFIVYKSKDGILVNGHFSSYNFMYSTFDEYNADNNTIKYIAINARKKENIKFYFFDFAGFGLEISDKCPLTDDETLLCFVETNGEVIFLIASTNFYDGKQNVSLTSTANADSMGFLRQNAFEMLKLISIEPIKALQVHFKE